MSVADVLAGAASWHVEQCDVRDGLAALPPGCVSVVITSPPYWGLRSYHAGAAELGSEPEADCLAWARGESPCVVCFICHLRTVLGGQSRVEGVWRVLRDDGLVVLDVGDSYNANSAIREKGARSVLADMEGIGDLPAWSEYAARGAVSRVVPGIAAKNLMLIPERLALAMQADGWVVRSAPWLKANPMPESAGDRPGTAHERIIIASKAPRYYWDADAIRVYGAGNGWHGSSFVSAQDVATKRGLGRGQRIERAARSYRTSDPYRAQIDAEIAAMTARLAELRRVRDGDGLALDEDGIITALWLASAPSAYDYCAACGTLFEGAARRRIKVQRVANPTHVRWPGASSTAGAKHGLLHDHGTKRPFLSITRTCPCGRDDAWIDHYAAYPEAIVAPWVQAGCPPGGLVVDPFTGSGTTGLVATRLGRRFLGLELSGDYAALARARLAAQDTQAPQQPAPGVLQGALWGGV